MMNTNDSLIIFPFQCFGQGFLCFYICLILDFKVIHVKTHRTTCNLESILQCLWPLRWGSLWTYVANFQISLSSLHLSHHQGILGRAVKEKQNTQIWVAPHFNLGRYRRKLKIWRYTAKNKTWGVGAKVDWIQNNWHLDLSVWPVLRHVAEDSKWLVRFMELDWKGEVRKKVLENQDSNCIRWSLVLHSTNDSLSEVSLRWTFEGCRGLSMREVEYEASAFWHRKHHWFRGS